jgi:hypothetical protein
MVISNLEVYIAAAAIYTSKLEVSIAATSIGISKLEVYIAAASMTILYTQGKGMRITQSKIES